jgi:hypothetical protein
MASVLNILGDWQSGNSDRERLFGMNEGLALRWLNEGQLRFADKSEVLRGVWSPTISSDGEATLPDDFLRLVRNRVQWDSNTLLSEIPHADAGVQSFSTTEFYSIWGGKLYIWAAAEGTPTIPYIKKPDEIAVGSITSAELDIPTEYHHELITFLDAMYERYNNRVDSYRVLLNVFDQAAVQAGTKYASRQDPIPRMKRGGL